MSDRVPAAGNPKKPRATEAEVPQSTPPKVETVHRFYTVTQACKKLGVEPYILRYWEEEFGLTVKRNSAGRRMYLEEQLELLATIKHLVRHEKLTIKGAKRQLAKMKSAPPAAADQSSQTDLLWLKKELISLKELLSQSFEERSSGT